MFYKNIYCWCSANLIKCFCKWQSVQAYYIIPIICGFTWLPFSISFAYFAMVIKVLKLTADEHSLHWHFPTCHGVLISPELLQLWKSSQIFSFGSTTVWYHYYTTFFFITDDEAKIKAILFIPDNPSSLIFVSKACTYPSGVPLYIRLLDLPANTRLERLRQGQML